MNDQSLTPYFKRLMERVKPFWLAFLVAGIANLIFGLIDASFISMMQPLIDKGLFQKNMGTLERAPYFVVILVFFRGIASFVAGYTMGWLGQRVVAEFRKDVFAKILRLPAGYFDNNASGDLISKLTYNADKLARTSSNAVTILVRESAFIIGGLTFMFITSWRLTLFFFISMPLIALVVSKASKKFKKVSDSMQLAMGSMTRLGAESISGYQTIRVFGAEKQAEKNFNATVEGFRARFVKMIITQNVSTPLIQLLASTGLALVLYVSLSAVSSGKLSAGEFTAMISFMMALLRPLKQLGSVNAQLMEGLVSARSLFEVLDAPEEVDSGTIEVEHLSGAVKFENVTYGYQDATVAALKQVSFEVPPASIVALVGHSGSGKSTLLKLLMRFYQPQQGRILFDGQDSCALKLNSLRKQISLVSQQVTLFNDSIRNNLCFGLETAPTDDKLIEVLRQTHAWQFVQAMPNGLDSEVGEGGSQLSGGQRQRLAIARALLRDTPLLLLDEATSALDSESENHIQAALKVVMQGRTTFVVAHRLSTIRHADVILVLDKGCLVEQGSHQQLFEKNGVYAHLHRLQFGDEHELGKCV